ncbi:MAG: hypothetical protein EOP49_02495 [Sphingobacteriales bacterium]|nr:MAG: hypothetical protein EOP49_02495 [Sphingobacteriales bacterium]
MQYTERFKTKIKNAKEEIDRFIVITEKQNGTDLLLYSFKDGFDALDKFIKFDQRIDRTFIKRWSLIYGQAFRSFEGHPFLDLLDDINKDIHSIYNNSTSDE